MGRKGPHKYDREEYLRNRERILEQQKAWKRRNREQLNERRPSRAGIPSNDAKKSYEKEYYLRNREKKLARAIQWAKDNPERRLDATLRREFGITKETYDSMLSAQEGRCAICKRPPEKGRLFVDHNHQTNAVRALLCSYCNTMLGMAFDSPELLRCGAEYLEKHSS